MDNISNQKFTSCSLEKSFDIIEKSMLFTMFPFIRIEETVRSYHTDSASEEPLPLSVAEMLHSEPH